MFKGLRYSFSATIRAFNLLRTARNVLGSILRDGTIFKEFIVVVEFLLVLDSVCNKTLTLMIRSKKQLFNR